MARGVPVVAARATALPETAGEAAVLFDPLDVDDLAHAITTALADHKTRAEAGRAHAATLSWDDTAEATVAAYRDALR
jgi:glycosyltransferase involved in cell wall biosynthesis